MPNAINIFGRSGGSRGIPVVDITSRAGVRTNYCFIRKHQKQRVSFWNQRTSFECWIAWPMKIYKLKSKNPGDQPERRKRVKKAYAPLREVQRVLEISNQADASRLDRHLAALTRSSVLRLGMALRCDSCLNTSWFSLDDLKRTLKCPRCLTVFSFPAGVPPLNAWAYRVLGPFATSNFANGAYCVAAAMHFIEEKIAYKATMIPSFEMKKDGQAAFEADFGAFMTTGAFSHITTPYLLLGECKSFNRFESKRFRPGAKSRSAFSLALFYASAPSKCFS